MLENSLKRDLRRRAHHLKPVVLVGQQGLSAAVIAEIERALYDHELIKIRFRGGGRDAFKQAVAGLAEQLDAELITRIGGTAVLYRENPETAKHRSSQ